MFTKLLGRPARTKTRVTCKSRACAIYIALHVARDFAYVKGHLHMREHEKHIYNSV
jgi:hypothetical protein